MKRAFEVKQKTFFFVSEVLSFKLIKQTGKNLADTTFKAGLSPSKKKFICFNESPLKIMKNAFYLALSVLKIFKFLSCLFGHVEKTT